MSHEVTYSYPQAPITVTHTNGRETDFEACHNGDVCIIFEAPDLGSYRPNATIEVAVWLPAADWRAVVAHVAHDLPDLAAEAPPCAASTDDAASVVASAGVDPSSPGSTPAPTSEHCAYCNEAYHQHKTLTGHDLECQC